MKETLDDKAIDMLRDLPDMIPVFRQFYEKWNNMCLISTTGYRKYV